MKHFNDDSSGAMKPTPAVPRKARSSVKPRTADAGGENHNRSRGMAREKARPQSFKTQPTDQENEVAEILFFLSRRGEDESPPPEASEEKRHEAEPKPRKR
eukprot:CAMPEP_0118933724 /NCGR_PEP_ID=MMETSP1169-20130426/12300_1 /TAXON_ID=36882 /ORGANISM="Pyramimonas obovata, Strain CCMP722" /LENGTH=100 /DNA_ID=CAMNT_0006876531 /DNA_START=470 /DNA_END=769 /DNA_ORIENTATION=-